MRGLARIGTLICLLAVAGCGEDPMAACLKQGLAGMDGEGASRGDYVKARVECARRLN